MRRALLSVAVMLLLGACGSEDPQPLVKAPSTTSDPEHLYGEWTARQPGGYTLRYVFRQDGTYEHVSGIRQKRPRGIYRYEIKARGSLTARKGTLVLRPRSGMQTRRDPDDPKGDYSRSIDLKRQRYEWSVRGSGRDARLRMTIGGGLAVTFRRQ